MKLNIERGALLKSLGHIQSVVERRNTIPILSNVLLEGEQGHLKLAATDLDIAISETVGGETLDPGGITAPAHTLYDIVRKLPEGSQVELSYSPDSQRLSISAGRSKFTLSCLPREDFPVMHEGELPHSFQVASIDLKRLIDKTRFAVSTEETRYYLNGIYMHVATDDDGAPVLRGVATDGHRLARFDVTQPEGAEGMPGVIVPRKAVGELRKLVDEYEGDVEVALSETKIRFAFADIVLTSKLIDGTFPDYSRVIPEGNDRVMEIDGKQFAEAVDRVSTISTDKTRAVKLSLGPGRLQLSVNSPEHGTATEELSCTYESEEMEIGFNSRYLLDILTQIEGDVAQILLAESTAPTVLKDLSDEGALYVLMPMRV
ncbi:DNA polymerase III subunit beta [Luteithermobacter gelatinilyticus]|uniref:DNA polymerase III subunit beta n=1 Tax=Luteithermobacter gelatinilyticus TaxID=2582913 RepID=UPI001105A069|nr:DNA polymerase III subunit beta [Luteithermobacter gelatinilyticus]|tara:strand:+ start:714 stop:1835 length:1122 start_codon:yes stop_codon:yes gene_type:complete